ncbi:MAG TPA: HAD hydrolase family protein [Opitutales bacterium]|nr:HAD hydrolase family protein [Opitutales bacterium]
MKSFDPARWADIKLFAMDVDGVLTDGKVTVFSNGVESKVFSILDGLGLRSLLLSGYEVAWISGRISKATSVRATELEIPHLFQGSREKQEILEELATKLEIPAKNVCYMGDDLVDLKALEWAGIAVAVPNAMPEVIATADYITQQSGGAGAVREICNHILAARMS